MSQAPQPPVRAEAARSSTLFVSKVLGRHIPTRPASGRGFANYCFNIGSNSIDTAVHCVETPLDYVDAALIKKLKSAGQAAPQLATGTLS